MLRNLRRTRSLCLLIGCIALLSGCASPHLEGFEEEMITVHETSALSGAALGQRKLELERAMTDLVAFQQTMEGMVDRKDRRSVDVFSAFVTELAAT